MIPVGFTVDNAGGPYVHGSPAQARAARSLAVEPCGPWRLSDGELEALDAAMQLDQAAADRMHGVIRNQAGAWEYSQEFVNACAEKDLDGASIALGATTRMSKLHDRWPAPGLVSVPTRAKRSSRSLPLKLSAQAHAMREALDQFAPDPIQTRLAKLRMSVGFAARCQDVHSARQVEDEALMITLTYRGDNDDWQPLHIKRFMDQVRAWCKSKSIPCRYVWVGELQKRGVIHYHVALWVPKGTRLPKPDEPTTYRVRGAEREAPAWWPHGMTRIEVARAAVPYLLKYLSKDTSKTLGRFPKGARIYGVGGLEHWARRSRRWLGLPSFVQAHASIDDDWQRAQGGGWFDPALNRVDSEFVREWAGDRYALRRVRQHGKNIQADGPFSWAPGRFARESYRGCFVVTGEGAACVH